MSRVFITGDRRPGHPAYLSLVAIEMLKAVSSGAKVVTSDNHGVDEIVRQMGAQSGVEVEALDVPRTPEGHRDYPAFLSDLDDDEGVTEIVVVHLEPHTSRLVSALAAHVDPDASRIVGAESLV